MSKKLPIHPLKKYPKNKTLYKIFRGNPREPKPSVCEHNKVGYRDLELIVRRSVLIISRLSKVLNEMEDKFTNTSETVEYLTERFEEREKDYIKAIKILKQRCEFLGEDKLFKRRPN